MRPQYLDSARENASIYLFSLCSNSTICRSTQGKTCELVSRTCERSSLRPKNPEMPKSSASVLKNMVTYPPPTHTFLQRRFLTNGVFSQILKSIHIPPPPPKVTTFWCIRPKVEKSLKKCENAPCWQETDVPERYPELGLKHAMEVWGKKHPRETGDQEDTAPPPQERRQSTRIRVVGRVQKSGTRGTSLHS